MLPAKTVDELFADFKKAGDSLSAKQEEFNAAIQHGRPSGELAVIKQDIETLTELAMVTLRAVNQAIQDHSGTPKH
jgi:hypothetical protein